MYAKLNLYHSLQPVTVEINGAWVNIWKEGKGLPTTQFPRGDPIACRVPTNADWYDERHTALMQAVYALEKAILDFA